MSLHLARAEIRHALIEGDNLDQAYPQPWRNGVDLAEQNLAAMWRNYRAAGYTRLIFTNSVSVLEIATLVAAIGGPVRSFGVLLTATDTTTAQRLARREIGTALAGHIERSKLAAIKLAAAPVYRAATDDKSVTDIAKEVISAAGWVV